MRLLIVDEEIITGGVETLRRQLVPELARLCESILWVLPAQTCPARREQMAGIPNLTIASLGAPLEGISPARLLCALLRRCPARLVPRRWQRLHPHALLRALARRHRSTHVLTTFILDQPLPPLPLPVAGFVADINPILPPATRANILSWVHRARATFAISEFTAAELRRALPACAGKIHAIPLAAPTVPSTPPSALEPVDFYYPAAANPHKGHATLLDACRILAERGRDFRLVLTGPGIAGFTSPQGFANPAMEPARRCLLEHHALLAPRLHVRGDLAPAQVEAQFAAARCIVLPSAYEGFGLPLAEALRLGKPVICTDIPAFTEQLHRYDCTDRATLVPVHDPARLAAAMEQHLDAPRPPLDPATIERRLARWTWTDAARRTRDLLAAMTR